MNKVKSFFKSKKIFKIKLFLTLFLLTILLSIGSICYAYYFTQGSFNGSTSLNAIMFAPKLNSSDNFDQEVSLAGTITNGKRLAPGAEGAFKMDIDFTYVSMDAYYEVYYSSSNIPNNIKFYVDRDYTTELNSIEGIERASNTNRLAEHFIYWRWIYDNSSSSNSDDNLYMDTDINVLFTAYVSQNIALISSIGVNDVEKPTGRVDLLSTYESNNAGSFNVVLDLSNLSINDDYRVYFDNIELSENLHLYSDSSYQDEITYIEGTYDGEHSIINKTIYWKLENDNVSRLSKGLYYVSVLGSW